MWLDERGPWTRRVVITWNRSPGGSNRTWLSDLRDLAGGLAGLAALVYLLGGSVVALRLFVAWLPPLTVVGGLPRESLLTVGLAQVLGFALVAAAVYAGVLFSLDNTNVPSRHERFSKKRRSHAVLHVGEGVGMTALLLLPAVFAATRLDVPPQSWDVLLGAALTLGLGWTFLYLNLRARIAENERFRRKWNSERRVLLSSALVGGLLVPYLVVFWSVQPLEAAVVCVDKTDRPHRGVLVGEAASRMYIGEPLTPKPTRRRTLVSLPAEGVKELYVGETGRARPCDRTPSKQPPVISRASARLWHGRIALSLRLNHAARVTATLRRMDETVRTHPFAGHQGLNRVRLGSISGGRLPKASYRVSLDALDREGRLGEAVSIVVRG